MKLEILKPEAVRVLWTREESINTDTVVHTDSVYIPISDLQQTVHRE